MIPIEKHPNKIVLNFLCFHQKQESLIHIRNKSLTLSFQFSISMLENSKSESFPLLLKILSLTEQ